MLNDKKGVVRVIEAFLASILLMSCLAMIPAQPNLTNPTGNLDTTAQNVLLTLNNNGHLTELIDNRNWTALQCSIAALVPVAVWFNLTVFNQNMTPLNSYPICNAGTVSNCISSVTYVCASQNSTYTIYILQLQLSQVEPT